MKIETKKAGPKTGKLVKLLFFLGISFGILATLFFRLGELLDISGKPERSDLIVSLGGDRDYDHVRKALELFENQFSSSGYIMINNFDYLERGGYKDPYKTPSSRYLLERGVERRKILFMKNAANTMGELRFVKKYLLDHGMRSVIIVSSPPHLRRIRFLASLNGFEESGIRLRVVGSDARWWQKNGWYRNRIARAFVFSELVKFPVNYIKYAILEPLGLLDSCRKVCHPLIIPLRRIYHHALLEVRRG